MPNPKKILPSQIRYGRSMVSAGNAAMSAVEDCAAFYGVRYYRMQSRVFTVPGRGGKDRPMFMGGWRDEYGVMHTKGMSDFLLTPRIAIPGPVTGPTTKTPQLMPHYVCVPLWVECKAGRDELSQDQIDFRDDVTKAGAFWLCCKDSYEELIAWFQEHGVTR
jgi:hypothetical protein